MRVVCGGGPEIQNLARLSENALILKLLDSILTAASFINRDTLFDNLRQTHQNG